MVLVLKRGATKRELLLLDKKLKRKKRFDVMKYCGVIKLKHDPLEIQRELRDEWE